MVYEKSTKVVFLAIAVLTLGMALIMRTITTNAGIAETLPGFVAFTSNFLIIVQFFAVAAAGSIVASEFEKGTIKLLLIRPKSRSTILLSKYLTSIFISLYYLAAFFYFQSFGVLFSFQEELLMVKKDKVSGLHMVFHILKPL